VLHDAANTAADVNPAQMGSFAQIGTGFASSVPWARNAQRVAEPVFRRDLV
jgi:hypothetical protein